MQAGFYLVIVELLSPFLIAMLHSCSTVPTFPLPFRALSQPPDQRGGGSEESAFAFPQIPSPFDTLKFACGPSHPMHLLEENELLHAFSGLTVLHYHETLRDRGAAELIASPPVNSATQGTIVTSR